MLTKFWPIIFLWLAFSCKEETKKDELLEEQSPERTGVLFANTITQSGENNVLAYPYYYNGGGIAAGDINNDGLVDLYFTGNQVANKLYLNKGHLIFEDITDKAGVAATEGWKTGVTMADVNQDGWLDIYVCRSAMGDSTLRKNLLFINNGNLTFTEKAGTFGIDDNSYSTQAAFLDYDKDNDLDLFLLNHSLPKYGGFSKLMGSLKNKKGQKFGSKLFENVNGKFRDVSTTSGIINNVLSFGLGVAVSDFNQDGWPDLYISNDFNEEDYLYINQHNGTFSNVIKEAMGHVSLFSMGSDAADINNDALTDIITLDMLPASNERIKLSSGDDNYDKYKLLIGAGFHHQSMRNMLQLNNGDGTFSEIGQLAGVSNTDWSWAALFTDFDGDGWKDLYVSNGYEKDYTNMQFLKFTVDEQVKARQTGKAPDLKLIMERMPSIQEGNFVFRNNGDLTFTDQTNDWGLSRKFKSNGAAAVDLDNDGDPDLVVNVMNGTAAIYKNRSEEKGKKQFLTIDLKDPDHTIEGAKIFVYTPGKKQYFEFSPTRGFQSAMYAPITVGLDTLRKADSIRIVWPDGKSHTYVDVPVGKTFHPLVKEAEVRTQRPFIPHPFFTKSELLHWKHEAADINDFKRQFLLPRMYSNSGPKMAAADVNKDGFVDIYFCGAKDQAGELFLQHNDGSFKQLRTPAFEQDRASQDEDALFLDADNDGDEDLYVVSGGYGFDVHDHLLQDRLYFNDGHGKFTRSKKSLPDEFHAGSCIASLDVDNDGDVDLFIGGGVIPGNYPMPAGNLLLLNNGKGEFELAPDQLAPALKQTGMITDVLAGDFDKDGKPDLLVAGEWMSLKLFANKNGVLSDVSRDWFSSPTSGWWNALAAEDFDADGDLDFVAGNFGENNQFKVSPRHPATLVYKDFNGDGQIDPFFCYYIGDQSYPYASRDEALNQVGFLKSRFPDYTRYATATLESMFRPEELKDAQTLRADILKTMYFENTGSGFRVHDLPVEAQFSSVYDISVFDIDADGDNDLILAGNDSNMRVRLGKLDANRGVILKNDGRGIFTYVPQWQSGLRLSGDVRKLLMIKTARGQYLITGVNNGEVECNLLNSVRPSEPKP